MKKSTSIFLTATLIVFSNCNRTPETVSRSQVDSVVYAIYETAPVVSEKDEDAADDPAIWVNKANPAQGLIIGTNKKGGINLYSLTGEELAYYPIGLVNNVDLRYGFRLADNTEIDFIAATNRSDNSLVLMEIDAQNKALKDIASRKIISTVGEVYGIALYHDLANSKFYVFIGGKEGETEQYELIAAGDNKIDARLVRKFSFPSQSEGMVADDENGILYVAEEDHCIWKIDASPSADTTKLKIAGTDSLNPKISYDIEGLTIYYAPENSGYLIASVQGNFSYAVFERTGDNTYIGSFTIKQNQMVDGVEETDGIDVTNLPLGPDYPNGAFIAQDGFNYEGDSLKNQNFKLVSWDEIAKLFEPTLVTDPSYIPTQKKH